ncbi:PREDICTED: vegetative cell wall protein gp1-like [Chinchilla lanigera]|uniref:vegetative cell wall protein gp1-like n=1 Tax=Chinchilla lanigera TaxID=34839 RepID=UPI0006961636|nr:PREDICTED: vegetative cell wall protein gp1-like [Chinchilla lanigera]
MSSSAGTAAPSPDLPPRASEPPFGGHSGLHEREEAEARGRGAGVPTAPSRCPPCPPDASLSSCPVPGCGPQERDPRPWGARLVTPHGNHSLDLETGHAPLTAFCAHVPCARRAPPRAPSGSGDPAPPGSSCALQPKAPSGAHQPQAGRARPLEAARPKTLTFLAAPPAELRRPSHSSPAPPRNLAGSPCYTHATRSSESPGDRAGGFGTPRTQEVRKALCPGPGLCIAASPISPSARRPGLTDSRKPGVSPGLCAAQEQIYRGDKDMWAQRVAMAGLTSHSTPGLHFISCT